MGAFGISKGPKHIRQRVTDQRARRLGMTSRQPIPRVFDVPVRRFVSPPTVCRERWLRKRYDATYHATVIRVTVEDEQGRRWTALQGRVFNASDGYLVSITGLYAIKPA